MNKDEFQTLLDEMCDEHELPRIPIKLQRSLKNMEAMFDRNEYIIVVTEQTSRAALYHEFLHYSIQLINVAQALEERICDYGAEGIIKELREREDAERTQQDIGLSADTSKGTGN